jgi:predicted RNase H-like HicB family nuclease
MKRLPPASILNMKVKFTREVDGRWIANIAALPGVMVYGHTRKQALAAVEALALQVLVDRIEAGETIPPDARIS